MDAIEWLENMLQMNWQSMGLLLSVFLLGAAVGYFAAERR